MKPLPLPPNAKRITLMRAGHPKRTVVITAPPFPEVGETAYYPGQDHTLWIITAVEDETVFLTIPRPPK